MRFAGHHKVNVTLFQTLLEDYQEIVTVKRFYDVKEDIVWWTDENNKPFGRQRSMFLDAEYTKFMTI